MKVALDTNFLIYAEGVNDAERRRVALDVLNHLSKPDTFIPVQVLGEFFHVLRRKGGRSTAEARQAMSAWRDAFPLIETTEDIMLSAADLAANHHFVIWDAVVLAAASQAGCRLLLSEDLQTGFTWRGTTIVNPFTSLHDPMLVLLLEDRDPK